MSLLAAVVQHHHIARSLWYQICHFELHFSGANNEPGPWYGWWSGQGGATAVITGPIVLAFGFYRIRNCHVHRCWRLNHHEITDNNGLTYKVCHKHNPGRPDKVTAEHVAKAHEQHLWRHKNS